MFEISTIYIFNVQLLKSRYGKGKINHSSQQNFMCSDPYNVDV